MRWFAFWCFLALGATVQAADFKLCKIQEVLDGDSFEVLDGKKSKIVNLSGIDCPELEQPFGKEVHEIVQALVEGRTVSVREVGRGGQGQIFGDIILPDGKDLGFLLLNKGYAWSLADEPELSGLSFSADPMKRSRQKEMKNAQNEKVGLWASTDPVPPWQWRKANAGASEAGENSPSESNSVTISVRYDKAGVASPRPSAGSGPGADRPIGIILIPIQ